MSPQQDDNCPAVVSRELAMSMSMATLLATAMLVMISIEVLKRHACHTQQESIGYGSTGHLCASSTARPGFNLARVHIGIHYTTHGSFGEAPRLSSIFCTLMSG